MPSEDRAREVLGIVRALHGLNRYRDVDDEMIGIIVEALLERGGFEWGDERVRAFTFKCLNNANITQWRRGKRHAELAENAEAPTVIAPWIVRDTAPDVAAEATAALELLKDVSEKSRRILMILIDGGSPMDVASEFNTDAWTAIKLIWAAREEVAAL